MSLSRLVFGTTLSGKLLRVVILNALMLLSLGVFAYLTTEQIRVMAERVAGQHVDEMRSNLLTAGRLTRLFADIEAVSRRFLGRDDWLLVEAQSIRRELHDTAQANRDRELAVLLERLDGSFALFVDACQLVNSALHQTESAALDADAATGELEQRLSAWLIEATLAGRRIDYVDQVMALTTGFRESLLQIGRSHAERNFTVLAVGHGDAGEEPAAAMLATFDDLLLRLQTLNASEPEIAALAANIGRAVRAYRSTISTFAEVLSVHDRRLVNLHEVHRDAALYLNELQSQNARQAGALTDGIGTGVMQVGSYLLVVVLLVAGVVTMLTLWIIRRNINSPLSLLLQGIRSIDRPDGALIRLDRSDEWQMLADALNRMQQSLGASYRQLQDGEAKYRLLIENQSDMVVELGADYRLRFASPSYAATIGRQGESLVGDGFLDTVHPRDRDAALATMHAMTSPPHTVFVQARTRTTTGWGWLAWNFRQVEGPEGDGPLVVGIGRDVTERHRAELALEAQRAFLHTVIDAVSDPVLVIGSDYSIRMCNRAAQQAFPSVAADARCHATICGRDEPCTDLGHGCQLRAALESEQPTTTVRTHLSARGERTYEVATSPLLGSDGKLDGVVQVYRDITEKLQAERHIRFLAHHDPLTELPNRVLLRDRFAQAAGNADRDGHKAVVMFLDLDHFKDINDTLGHHMGDLLLQAVVGRVRGTLRETDTISRQGGDEFVILVPRVTGRAEPERIAEHIRAAMEEVFHIGGHDLRPSFSIGIALYPDDGREFDTVLKHADIAMYSAKEGGRNTYRFYADRMHASPVERLRLHTRLRNVVEHGELMLCYQPQWDIGSRRLVGAEALLRWHTQEFGVLLPDQFIAAAEACGVIGEIGHWTIRSVCQQLAQWRREPGRVVPVSINLSALQLDRQRLVDEVAALLTEYDVAPAMLEFELTESTLFRDTHSVISRVTELKRLGIHLSIDDFGTGYSSLVYLKQFQPDRLKIDRSFIENLDSDTDDGAIVRAIIRLAHSLDMRVIAEGVETPAQFDWLQREGCDQVQGFLLGEPLPLEQMTRLLRQAADAATGGVQGLSNADSE